jgi:hypothetical protein
LGPNSGHKSAKSGHCALSVPCAEGDVIAALTAVATRCRGTWDHLSA